MASLNQAIETETRRIKKEIKKKQAEKSALVVMPNIDKIPLKERIRNIIDILTKHLSHPERTNMKYSELAPTKEEKLASFLPFLQLINNEKIYVHQPNHFDEIYMAFEVMQEEIELLKKDIGLIAETIQEVEDEKWEGFEELGQEEGIGESVNKEDSGEEIETLSP